ncbi:MAG: hypothetical protein NT027_07375 [Proteobacteria bacterium]|nr:hypothetical protein [Pseudomonadota bacterium]
MHLFGLNTCVALVLAMSLVSIQACKPRKKSNSSDLESLREGRERSLFEAFVPPANLRAYTLQTLQDQNLRTQFELFSLSVPQLGALTGNFQMSIDEVQEGIVLREERWRSGVDVGPGSIIQSAVDSTTLPINFSILGGREVTYTRAFDDLNDAARAKFVTLAQLPVTAEKAIAMKPDDFVSIPTNMGLALGLGLQDSGIQYAASIGASVFWLGEYRINFYRMTGQMVRVKIAPSSQKGVEIHSNVGARLDLFGSFADGLVNVDRQVEKALGLDLFKASRSRVFEADRYAIDYVFNLQDAEAREAYDSLLTNTLTLKRPPSQSRVLPRGVRDDIVFADLTPAESLLIADRNKPEGERRVDRVFQGYNQFTSRSRNLRLGPKAFRYAGSKSLSFHKLKIKDVEGRLTNRTTQFYTSNKTTKSWVSFYRESVSFNAASMFDSDRDFKSHDLRDIEFSWSVNQNDLSAKELDDIRGLYYAAIGRRGYEQLNISNGLNLGSNPKKFQSVLKASISRQLIVRFREEILRDSKAAFAMFTDSLTEAINRYKGSKSRFEHFSETIKRGATANWVSVNSNIEEPLIAKTKEIRRLSDAEYLGEVFKIMNVPHPAGEIIVPAFLLNLATRLGVAPIFSISESVRDGVPYQADTGQDPNEEYRNEVHRAFYTLTNLGYESSAIQ